MPHAHPHNPESTPQRLPRLLLWCGALLAWPMANAIEPIDPVAASQPHNGDAPLGDPCADFTFPYTLSGADNAARVAELRQAIECANANATADVVDLGGHTLVLDDAPYSNAHGDTALPFITSEITLQNGQIDRDDAAPAFRLILSDTTGTLTVRNMQLLGGSASGEGGAILALGTNTLTIRHSVFENNHATSRGGAVSAHGTSLIAMSDFTGNVAPAGAALAAYGSTMHFNNRFIANGNAGTDSVLWNDYYAALLGSLFADNHLSASGSSLMVFTSNTAVAEMRHLTIADNVVQGPLLRIENGNTVQVRNSILWGNTSAGLGDITPWYSLFPGAPAAGGNVGTDPMFVATPGNYRLAAGSPAIDAADQGNSFSDFLDVDDDGDLAEIFPDLDLNPRPWDDPDVPNTGLGDPSYFDMGAYERQPQGVLPTLSIDDVSANEGNSGATDFVFTISLNNPAPLGGVAFDIATSDGTATTADGDYVGQSLTAVLIPAGQTSTTFTVAANGDTETEEDETFFVTVTNIVNAVAGDTQGTGTILNDDVDLCAGFSFPYTLSGANNTARVAELRQAIHCANANATADVIDLGGATLLFINADPSSGDAALPNVASAITLRNGTLQRDAAAAEFRLLTVEGSGEFIGETLAFRNGLSDAGAAIYNNGTLAVNDVGFFDNGDRVLTAEGGAIYHGSMAPLRIVDSVFQGNAATSGGAVFMRNGDLWMHGSLLQGNQADEGGALYTETMMIRVFDNAFVANQAQRGGAIKVLSGQISGTRFEGNSADEIGGAVLMEWGFADLFVSNSLFIGNQAPDGAAVVGYDAMTHLHNVTISGHPAGAGNLLASNGDEIVLANSIVWGNNGRPLGTATVRHSLVEGGYAGGTGIIDLDPRFVDAANGDFRLAANSPAIDAGNNADVRFDTWWDIDDDGNFDEELEDLDGNPRRHDDAGVVDTGVGTAPIVDLGAYERQTDSDGAGISVNPTSGLITTEAGGTASFTVVLDTQPSADVVIGLSSSDTTEGTVAPASLTFTPANWNVPQTVTVTGVDDFVVDGPTLYEISVATVSSADPAYAGVAPAIVSVTNIDNDLASFTIQSGTLVTTEAGGTGTFTVVLNSQPGADVIFDLSSTDPGEGTPSPASLVFTPGNWNVAQTATVTGVDDFVADGNINYAILLYTTSTDPLFNGIGPGVAYAINMDDDTAGIIVSPTSGLVTTEGFGPTGSPGIDQFSVVLNSEPTADVVIGLSSSDTTEGTVPVASLTFTAANWNVAQHVDVYSVDDNEVDGDITYTIVTAAAVSADSSYDGLDPADVSVTNMDNDIAGITVNPTSGLTTTEAGGTASFTVVLNTQPSADVTIGLSSSDTTEGTVAPASLTFTAANWNVAQTITVTGVDDNEVDGDITYSIVTAAATSADPNYSGIDPADVSVINTDNDSAGITVTPTSGLATTEGVGPTGTPGVDQFSLVLNSQPTADVIIGLSSSDTTEGTVSVASLTFTAANWNVAQHVDVYSVDDNEVDGDITYTIVTAAAVSADANYNGLDPADVSVTNSDDDSAGITVNPTSGLVTSEASGTATFSVVLNTQPSADVTIGLSSSDTTEGTVAPASLTFTAANWNIMQTVTVTGVDDNDVDGDIAYTIVTAAAVSADPNYDGMDPADVAVTNTDDDVHTPLLVAFKSVSQIGTDSQPVIYEIVLSNIGEGDQADDPASHELSDLLPSELALVNASADAGNLSLDLPGNAVHWNGSLAAGATVTIQIEANVVITQPAIISNQANVHYDGDGDGSNDATALSTDPAEPGNEVPTRFQFAGAAPPISPAMIPASGTLALFSMIALMMLAAGFAFRTYRH